MKITLFRFLGLIPCSFCIDAKSYSTLSDLHSTLDQHKKQSVDSFENKISRKTNAFSQYENRRLETTIIPTTASFSSKSPTILPSASPILTPTAAPTPIPIPPSGKPTYTSTYSPTSFPSISPFPTSQPSSSPSWSPSSQPSSTPTSAPTTQPTSSPTVVPSAGPTPGGELGRRWWYLVSGYCTLYINSNEGFTQEELDKAVSYAFWFLLTDPVEESMRNSLTVFSEHREDGEKRVNKALIAKKRGDAAHPAILSVVQSGDTSTSTGVMGFLRKVRTQDIAAVGDSHAVTYFVQCWCPEHSIGNEVKDAFFNAQENPIEVREPLHEQGMRSITNITIDSVSMSTTTMIPPNPSETELNPVGIVYIILGTVLFFIAGLIIIRFIQLGLTKDANKVIREKAQTGVNNVTGCCSGFCLKFSTFCADLQLYYREGFELTSVHEDEDDDDLTLESYDEKSPKMLNSKSRVGKLRKEYEEDDHDSGKFRREVELTGGTFSTPPNKRIRDYEDSGQKSHETSREYGHFHQGHTGEGSPGFDENTV